MHDLESILKDLSQEERDEVAIFVQKMMEERMRRPRVYMRRDWGGRLVRLRERYSGVSLQKQAILLKEV